MEYDINQKVVIALDSVHGLEYKHKEAILNSVKNPSELLFDKNLADNILSGRMKESCLNTLKLALDEKFADYSIEKLVKREIKAVTIFDKEYPQKLKNIALPPLVLYCKGQIDLLNAESSFAIVGSRKTLPFALAFAKEIAEKVSLAGGTVVSGSADGADRAALMGAIENAPISVIAGGHDFVYPEANRELINKVAKNGLVVSETPPDIEPKPWMFPIRNRIIAALSQGVLIISGKRTSGARHTADFALDYGKEVFAIPYSIGITSGELNNYLIKNGAALCDEPNDILDFLKLSVETVSPVEKLSHEQKNLYLAIKEGSADINSLMAEFKIPYASLAAELSALELEGLIVKQSGNKYKAVK